MMKVFIVLFILFCCLGNISCQSEADKKLEYALVFAGKNRTELEKVLEHYKDSTEKLAAARFLIENMPRWFSYTGWQLDSIKAIYEKIIQYGYLPEEETKQWETFQYTNLVKVYDAKVITADFLTDHIDRVFAARDRRVWNKYISFEDFCEFLLPYRIANEPLEAWHGAYAQKYVPLLDSLYQGSDVVKACQSMVNFLRKEGLVYNDVMEYPHLGGLFLLNNRIGKCTESCDLAVYVMRSLGIPAGIDFYFFSPSRRNGHSWNVVRDTTGGTVPFWIDENNAARGQGDGRRKGKVYRHCFGVQRELADNVTQNTAIAYFLKNRFMKDATADYFGKNQLKLPVTGSQGGYAYLCVFSVKGWQPIAVGSVKHKEVIFPDVEPNIVYQLQLINEYGTHTQGYPFIFDGKSPHFFIPDPSVRETIDITRKYPISFNLYTKAGRVAGGKIEGSHEHDLKNPQFIYTIADTPQTSYNYISLPREVEIRYLRYTPLPDIPGDIAELAAYRDSISSTSYPSKVVASGSYSPEWKPEYVNDNDPISFASVRSGHITLDFGRVVKVGKILYIPRNDDNFIRVGDTYELFYNNGNNTWCPLGKQTAREAWLRYDNIPVNALLWLKDLTRGDEEQVFFCKGGKQVFLSDDIHPVNKDLYNPNAL